MMWLVNGDRNEIDLSIHIADFPLKRYRIFKVFRVRRQFGEFGSML